MRILLIAWGLLFYVMSCAQDDRINIQRNLQQSTHDGFPVRNGGIPVPGASIITDALGRPTFARDTSILLDNGKIVRIYTNLINPSDTLKKDTIDSEALLQTLSNVNDSLSLSLGNTVRRDIVTFDQVALITGDFPVGTVIQTRGFSTPGDGAGAMYKVAASSIWTPDDTTVFLRNSKYIELQPINNEYDIRWFGAKTSGDAYYPIQKAINYAYGENIVKIPHGNFSYSQTLTFGDRGIKLVGVSTSPDAVPSKITYTGTGNAIELSSTFTSGWNKIEIENIHIVGTSSATGGLILDAVGKSVYGANIKGVVFSNFDGAGVYATELNSVYNVQFTDNCRWQNNTNDILATGVVQSVLIDNAWLTNATDVSIHAENLGGRFTISNTIIDAAGLGFWQESVSNATSGVLITHSHFEDNDQNLNVDAGYFWLDNTILSNPQTTADNLADGVIAQLDNVHGNTTTPMVLGLGSTWSNLHGRYVLPVHNDASTILNPSTIIEVNSSVPTDISGVNVGNADRFAGTMTLRFMDGNTTIQSSAGSNARFYLEGDINWTPSTGDYIVFKKYKYVTGDRAYFIEIGRYTVAGERFYSSIVGGISTTSDLSFKTTTAAGATGADMHFLVGNNGATEAMTILNNGNVGFGDTSPGYKVDIVGTSGSQLRLASVTTDAATKAGYLDVRPFNNSDRDLTLIQGTTTGSSSTVNVGGGTSLSNASTRIGFWTAGNTTTQTGTEKVRIDNEGLKVGTTDNGAYEFQVNGNSLVTGSQTHLNTSDASSTTDGASIWAKDVTAGQTELFARGETGSVEQVTGLVRYLNTQVDATTTSYAGVSDLTFNVEAGKKYAIYAVTFMNNSAGGGKVTISGTATATNFTVFSLGGSKTTALGSNILSNSGVGEQSNAIHGSIEINTGGTLQIQFAQVDTDGGTSSLEAGSIFQLKPVSN